MKQLIVNADDYGHSPGTSAGIRKAHLEGILTTTTTMMNVPDAIPALRLAREETPDLGVGVHLIITHGAPLRGADSVPSLVGPDGMFFDLAGYYQHGAQMDATELKDEWRAQIEKFLSTGTKIDHIDCHHHGAYMFEQTMGVLFDLAAEYDAPIRHPLAGRAMHDVEGQARFDDFAPRIMSSSHVRYPDVCDLRFYDTGVSLENLMRIIESLPDGTTELMTHPAILDDEIMTTTSYNTMRAVELDLLTDERVKQTIRDCGIKLVTFRTM